MYKPARPPSGRRESPAGPSALPPLPPYLSSTARSPAAPSGLAARRGTPHSARHRGPPAGPGPPRPLRRHRPAAILARGPTGCGRAGGAPWAGRLLIGWRGERGGAGLAGRERGAGPGEALLFGRRRRRGEHGVRAGAAGHCCGGERAREGRARRSYRASRSPLFGDTVPGAAGGDGAGDAGGARGPLAGMERGMPVVPGCCQRAEVPPRGSSGSRVCRRSGRRVRARTGTRVRVLVPTAPCGLSEGGGARAAPVHRRRARPLGPQRRRSRLPLPTVRFSIRDTGWENGGEIPPGGGLLERRGREPAETRVLPLAGPCGSRAQSRCGSPSEGRMSTCVSGWGLGSRALE